METVIYFIRHSIRLNEKFINNNSTQNNKFVINQKVILNTEGEKRAEILSNEKELQNIDVIYSSSLVRAIQTAKYLAEKQDLPIIIDKRFNERNPGKPNDYIIKDWWLKQYLDENYKTEGGESQKEIRERVYQAFNEILKNYKGKRIAIFSHGYTITFFLMKWCTFNYIRETDNIKFTFNNKEIFNKKVNAPEVFKLIFDDNNNLLDIQNIKFEDLQFKDGMGN